MRKRAIRTIVIAVLLCLFAVLVAPGLFRFPVIGRVFGVENEYLEIDGAVYERTTSHPYTSLDREKYIGAVRNKAITMRIFEVEGVEDREYLHALWDWEGYFYVRQRD